MDFKVDWEIIDEKKRIVKAKMVPDPDRYERRTIDGKDGYFDKYDRFFFQMKRWPRPPRHLLRNQYTRRRPRQI